MKNILTILFIAFCASAYAQGGIYLYPSDEGNLIRVLLKPDAGSELLKNTAYFRFTRSELRLNNTYTKAINIGKTIRAKTVSEFRAMVTSQGIESLKEIKNYTSDQQIQDFLNVEYNYDSLATLSMFSHKYLLATGLGFMDKDTEKDMVYEYKAYRIDINGKEEPWGAAKIVSNVPNPLLSQIEIMKDSIISGDSLVFFQMHVEFPKYTPTVNPTFPSFQPINTPASAKEQRKLLKEQNAAFVDFLNKKPINLTSTTFQIYYQIDNKPWIFYKRLLLTPTKEGVFEIGAFIETTPESLVSVRVFPETYGNEHPNPEESQIYSGYAISQNTVQLINAVNGKDSTDCIHIYWPALPDKPYYQGIVVEKISIDSIKTFEMLSRQATNFTDHEIKPGENYTYMVKAVFDSKQNVKQEAGSNVVQSCTTFSMPLPPFNLKLDTASKAFPILSWEATPSPSRFGFIVYRGLSQNKMTHLGDVVKGTTFADTNGVFSPKGKYFYAVLAQNLSQDTSDFSNIVEFIPILPVDVSPPPFLNFRLVNGDVVFDWTEMRANDSFIGGYVLERKNSKDSLYSRVHDIVLSSNYFTDTTHVRGETYDYRIASVATNGQLGKYSMPHEVFFSHPTPSALTNFKLNNFEKGVQVKWSAAELANTKSYIIYRNNPPLNRVQKLAEVPAGTFEFVDRTVSKEGSYIYAMSKIDKNGSDSPMTHRKSIKRKLPNKIKP